MPNGMEDMDVADSSAVVSLSRTDEVTADEAVSGMIVAPPPMLSPVNSMGGSSDPSGSAIVAPPFDGPAPIEIAFSFDTTGSMSSCLENVQNNLKTIINRLLMDIPALKIAVFAHGDYCDGKEFYVTKFLDFTNNVNDLFDFVTNCGGTGGGDFEECYELVLRKIRQDLTWTPGTTKSVVMIGDAIPHPPGHGGNDDCIDWRTEADALYMQLGARVYAVQCLNNKGAASFWEQLSQRTYGKHLQMEQLDTIVELMMAICYKEGGHPHMFDAYEHEIRARDGAGMRRDLDHMFNVIRDGAAPCDDTRIAHVAPRVVAKKKTKSPTTTTKACARSPRSHNSEVGKLVANSHAINFKLTGRIQRPQAAMRAIAKKREQRKVRFIHRKLLREKVACQQFILSDLRWSPWKLYSDDVAKKDHNLFNHNKEQAAIYEVAVQPCQRSNNSVVMFRTTNGLLSGVNWDTCIMRGKFVREQMNSVLSQGCRIVVRRAYLPRVHKCGGNRYKGNRAVATLLRQTYHYAWMKTGRGGTNGREVTRRGKMLSKVLS